jgi:leucyl aminopeptidase (aminopeptidase T)
MLTPKIFPLVLTACLLFAETGAAQTPDLQAVALNLVQAGAVAPSDKVLVTGSVRDAELLEHVAIETMKAGGQPLISIESETLWRRSYDEVPASYDTLPPVLNLTLLEAFDIQIAVDVAETEGVLAHVPPERLTARARAAEPATRAFFEGNVRFVNLGNGLYPTDALARGLGVPRADLASAFWKGAAVQAETLRAKATPLQDAFAGGGTVTVTHPNGTHLTFRVDPSRGFVSDGALSPDEVRRGGAASTTWIPAGELIYPAVEGTADGRVVVERVLWEDREVRGLELVFEDGRLTSMTAESNLEGLQAAYDAATGGKDLFGYVDIGLNPETALPTDTGRVVWMAPGAVTLGVGDNRGFGGTNASEFGLAVQLGGATVSVDGTTVVNEGRLVE